MSAFRFVTRSTALFAAMSIIGAAAALIASQPASQTVRMPAPDRPVSSIVSAAWDDEAARDRAGEFAAVARTLDIQPGQTVADIGAGSGYYTIRLSPVVGPGGRVIAQDVMQSYLDRLARRVRVAKLGNVRFVRGTQSNPRLPANAVDVALMIHMYHEISQPYALLNHLRISLKPNGRLAIVDLERDPENHGMPRELLVCEVRAVGYELVAINELAVGYLAIFKLGPAKDPRTVKACRR